MSIQALDLAYCYCKKSCIVAMPRLQLNSASVLHKFHIDKLFQDHSIFEHASIFFSARTANSILVYQNCAGYSLEALDEMCHVIHMVLS